MGTSQGSVPDVAGAMDDASRTSAWDAGEPFAVAPLARLVALPLERAPLRAPPFIFAAFPLPDLPLLRVADAALLADVAPEPWPFDLDLPAEPEVFVLRVEAGTLSDLPVVAVRAVSLAGGMAEDLDFDLSGGADAEGIATS